MSSRNNVHNTHISRQVRALHLALLDIIGVMNRPQRDEALMRKAGLRLDSALFPLLIGIERYGPIGVVELADRAGRDHTTVSRQVAKLEALGLVARRDGETDRRRREALVTPSGAAATLAVDRAREQVLAAIFAAWAPGEVDELVRLARKYADGVLAAD